MDVHPKQLPLTKLLDYVQRHLPAAGPRPRAWPSRSPSATTCRSELFSDEQRLQQILRNLLSNAVKFTSSGGVELRVERRAGSGVRGRDAARRRRPSSPSRSRTPASASRPRSCAVIFEAFQQSDGTTSRKYGGTGLGLSISREIAGLLGGRIDRRERAGRRLLLHPLRARAYAGVVPAPDAGATAGRRRTARPCSPHGRQLPDVADYAPSGVSAARTA